MQLRKDDRAGRSDRARAAPLALIAARARNGVIGRDGVVPWDLPEDRAHFRRTTWGHTIIMGRRTWDETGRALPGRRNLVVSRAGAVSPGDREVFASLEDAIAAARTTDAEPFVIGGAQMYALALPLATKLVLTEVDLDAEGDTTFPRFDPEEDGWRMTASRRGDRATYVTYEREAPPSPRSGERGPEARLRGADG